MKKTSNFKTEWDFLDLYSGITDPKLEKDIEAAEKAYADFAKKYSKKDDYLKDEKKLKLALDDYEKLVLKTDTSKPLWYLSHMQSVDSQNKIITSQLGLFEPRLTKSANQILFFGIKIAKIEKKLQDKFLKSPVLKEYGYFLKQSFDSAKYLLAEGEEKIMNLKSRTSRGMWIDGFEKLLGKQTIKYKGKNISMAEAMNTIPTLQHKERHELHNACMEVLKGISYFAENEINAVYSDKKVNDELRGFKEPYSSTILHYQNDEKSVLSLVDTVTKGFKISQRFYKLKARLLGLKQLGYADRNVGIGKNATKVTFEEALDITLEGFRNVKPQYADQLSSMLKNGRIDVFPKVGKRGGAYCSGGIGVPTIVMLNHTPELDAVMTLAHEMGHAIHTDLSKKVRPVYQGYTTSVAEVASTFFENLAFEKIFSTLTPQEQIIALHDRIQDFISTIFRQIACFNFELEVHSEIRKKGALSAEEIGALHNKNMSAYMGPVTKLTQNDGYFFTAWPHIRNFFYVYSYAYGALISRALYKNYLEDNSYIEKVNSFMEAGASMSPEDIFKSIGIDTSKPAFFADGLKTIEKDVDRLEKLAKKAKMIK